MLSPIQANHINDVNLSVKQHNVVMLVNNFFMIHKFLKFTCCRSLRILCYLSTVGLLNHLAIEENILYLPVLPTKWDVMVMSLT